MRHDANKCWSLLHAAGLGALLGVGFAVGHTLLQVFRGDHFPANPLVHILLDYVGFIAAGAFLLAIVAEVRNRLVKAK